MRAEILFGKTVGRERWRDQMGERDDRMRAKSVRLASGRGFGRGSTGTVCGKLSWGKRSGQLLLTAKVTERNKFWKGQPLAR